MAESLKMYKNTIKSAGVGVYRISAAEVWPAFLNPSLWTLFNMSKEDFIHSININNILGGKYTQTIDLHNQLCQGNPIQTRKGLFNATGLTVYQSQIPLAIVYSIKKIDEETSLLFFMVLIVTAEIKSYIHIIETFDINNLIFNELDEVGVEYDKLHQLMRLKTSQFCLESCWDIDTQELVSFLLRFLHPEDHKHFRNKITLASEKLSFGNIPLRLCVLQKEYRPMEFWYSSSVDQNGQVYKIQGIITQSPSIELGDNLQQNKFIPQLFTNDKKLLHLIFDMDTNQRIPTENDLDISFLTLVDYQSSLTAIRDIFLRAQDNPYIDCLRERYSLLKANAKTYDFYCCDVRMLSCFDKSRKSQSEYRWYHIVQELFLDIRTGKAICVLSVYDIEEIKHKGHIGFSAHYDNDSMYMQNFDTFIIRFMEYFSLAQEAKDAGNYSALALVKINADPNTLENMEESDNQAMKIINALMHKDEIYSKYTQNVYAILFHDLNHAETIQERIRMLDIVLSSISSAEYSVSVNIGYCVMNDNDPGISSLLLERAYFSLFWASIPGNQHIFQYSQENEEYMKRAFHSNIDKTAPLAAAKTTPNVFIRTFGSFDIFVDNRAIAFTNDKAKELLAILVDRREGFVTPSQAISYLWEDEPSNKKVLSRLRKVALLLKRQLEKYGIDNIVESVNGKRRLVMRKGIDCDYYTLLSNDVSIQPFVGTYMPEYSWAETTNAILAAKYNYYYDDVETMPRIH